LLFLIVLGDLRADVWGDLYYPYKGISIAYGAVIIANALHNLIFVPSPKLDVLKENRFF